MVNIEDFIKRLEKILDYYSLTASSFADKIGVQRSSMSHLLSGRNKPSLDFILKILEVFPEVDLYWILNGKGDFPKNNNPQSEVHAPISNPTEHKNESDFKKDALYPVNFSNDDKVERIIIFYKNGTFKEYQPQ